MFLFTHSAGRVVAAAALLGTFALASPLGAASGDFARMIAAQPSSAHEVLAQAASSEATPPAAAPEESAGAAAKANAAVSAEVEAHIKAMRSKLHITTAQEPQWNAVAQVMRD